MEVFREQKGNVVSITSEVIMDASGNPLTGKGVGGTETAKISVIRLSDLKWLDWDDDTFKALGWTTRQKVMTELDDAQTESQGVYYTSWTLPNADEEYLPFVFCVDAGDPTQQGNIIVGSFVEHLDASINEVKDIATDTRRIVKNRLTIDESNSKLQLWNDAGDTVIREWPLTDKDGSAIVLQGTGPANRGAPVTP